MEMKLELVLIPVTDVDRAKRFYLERLGFVEDVDVQPAAGVRVVQLTPEARAARSAWALDCRPTTRWHRARSRACTWWWPTSSRRALSWLAAALRSAPWRMWAEESSTPGWPTQMAIL